MTFRVVILQKMLHWQMHATTPFPKVAEYTALRVNLCRLMNCCENVVSLFLFTGNTSGRMLAMEVCGATTMKIPHLGLRNLDLNVNLKLLGGKKIERKQKESIENQQLQQFVNINACMHVHSSLCVCVSVFFDYWLLVLCLA